MRFITWMVYITLLIVSTAFTVLYKDMLALILMCVVIAVPVIMLLDAVIIRLFTRVKCEINDSVVQAGQSAVLKITVKNISPLSSPKIALKIGCSNSFMRAQSVCKTFVSAKAFSTNTFEYNISSGHAGRMQVTIKRAYLYDIFRMFVFTQKLNTYADITFLPQVFESAVNVRDNIFAMGETDVFAPNKKGDDPSEVFNIREYEGGDKLNRIHWKLSTKQNKYMVKEYSCPISESILLLADLNVKDKSRLVDADTMLCALMSISMSLIKMQKMFSIGWYECTSNDETNGVFVTEKINDENDLYMCMAQMFSSHIGNNYPDIAENEFSGFTSHRCIFTADNTILPEKRLYAVNKGMVLYSAVSVGKREGYSEYSDETYVSYIQKDSVQSDLEHIIL